MNFSTSELGKSLLVPSQVAKVTCFPEVIWDKTRSLPSSHWLHFEENFLKNSPSLLHQHAGNKPSSSSLHSETAQTEVPFI